MQHRRNQAFTSLNRPGGNVTGVVFTSGDLTAKRLGLLHEVVPNTVVIAALLDPNAATSWTRPV
jgi:putative ABC transport system substrate-binding protein